MEIISFAECVAEICENSIQFPKSKKYFFVHFISSIHSWEVRCVRRTLKDLLTLIPYSIILAIPMTPVGHVVVFNVIQRLFPAMFVLTAS